jgi:hypothetical protein
MKFCASTARACAGMAVNFPESDLECQLSGRQPA